VSSRERSIGGFALRRTTSAEQVASVIRDRILRGELARGEPLQELALARSLGVSRNTLREAIRILVREGLIRHSLHRGVSVSALAGDEIAEIYTARLMLELRAVEAARSATRAELLPLEEAIVGLKEAVRDTDWPRSVEKDMLFHRRLVGLLRSQRINQFFESLLAELRLGLVLVDRAAEGGEELIQQHAELLRLLVAGRYGECAEALRVHLELSEQRLHGILAGQTAEPATPRRLRDVPPRSGP
jgi:DNA-binding GntR family transcriptional regulator